MGSVLPKGLTWSSSRAATQVPTLVPAGLPVEVESEEPLVVSVDAPAVPIDIDPSPPVTVTPPPPTPDPVEPVVDPLVDPLYIRPRSLGEGTRKRWPNTPRIQFESTERRQKDLRSQLLSLPPEERMRLKREEYLRDRGVTVADPMITQPVNRSDLEGYQRRSEMGMDSLTGPQRRGRFFAGSYRTDDGDTVPLTPGLIRYGIANIDGKMSAAKRNIFDLEDMLGDRKKAVSRMAEIKDIPPMIVGLRLQEYKNEKPFTPEQKKLVRQYLSQTDSGNEYFDTLRFKKDYSDMLKEVDRLEAKRTAFSESLKPKEAAKARLEYQLHTLLNQK